MSYRQNNNDEIKRVTGIATMNDLDKATITAILKLAIQIKRNPQHYTHALYQKTLMMMFQKPSLRTRVSFETGMVQLGGHAIDLSISDSPLGTKETITDTAKVLSRYVNVIMARVKSRRDIKALIQNATVPVINALDDYGHPCQMLADFLTIMEKKIIPNNGQVKWEDLKLAYLGDLKNNVTYDLMRTCSILGIEMRVSGPNSKEFAIEESVWDEVDKRLVKYYENPQDAVRDVDIVYTDSWMSYGIGHDEESYRRSSLIQYRVTTGLLTHAKKDVIFMNCLPADRTAEQEADVIDNPQVSVVYDEAENRLHAQKALLLYLLAYDKYFATRDMNCVVVALGGNALSVGDDNSYKAQIQKCKETCNMLVRINLKTHATLCISHGNGPQVGTIYQQNQDAEEGSRMPLSVCGAQSQGMIGYMIAQELHNACCGHDQLKHEVRGISTIVTQTIVDEHDKAFKKPNKPIGSHLSESEMKQEKQKDSNKEFHEDSSEKGKYRLVVPSPEPIGFLESKTIQDLVGSGHWVICGGGGGVPVVKDSQGRIKGVDGVVDKDKTAAKLGELVHADMLLILTNVQYAYKNYSDKEKREKIKKIKASELQALVSQGHFSEGDMLPKIQACISFVKQTGKRAIITDIEHAAEAIDDSISSAGTIVVADHEHM